MDFVYCVPRMPALGAVSMLLVLSVACAPDGDVPLAAGGAPGTTATGGSGAAGGGTAGAGVGGAAACASQPNGTSCDDGDACTVGDSCQSGVCASGAPMLCDTPPNSCYQSAGGCTLGVCSYPFDDGAACDDGSACTSGDTCLAGSCGGGTPTTCSVGPSAQCINATTLRTYAVNPCGADGCTPTYSETTCTGGCVNGACAACSDELLIVDHSAQFWESRVAVDSGDTVHLAYGGSSMPNSWMARRSPGQNWLGEVVSGVPYLSTWVLDGAGTMHFSWVASQDLMRAERASTASSWTFHTVMAPVPPAIHWVAGMQLGPTGDAHYLYKGANTSGYIHEPETGPVSTAIIDSWGSTNYVFSAPVGLAVDPAGNAHALYRRVNYINAALDSSSLGYKYKTPSGAFASEEMLVSNLYNAEVSSPKIVADATGGIHLVYCQPQLPFNPGGNHGQIYRYKPTASATFSAEIVVDPIGCAGAIAIDAAGQPAIVYTRNTEVWLARRDASMIWSNSLVAPDYVLHATIAADSSNAIHITYAVYYPSPYNGAVKYARVCP